MIKTNKPQTATVSVNMTAMARLHTMGVVPPYRELVTGREIKGTETCDLTMTDLVTPLTTGYIHKAEYKIHTQLAKEIL